MVVKGSRRTTAVVSLSPDCPPDHRPRAASNSTTATDSDGRSASAVTLSVRWWPLVPVGGAGVGSSILPLAIGDNLSARRVLARIALPVVVRASGLDPEPLDDEAIAFFTSALGFELIEDTARDAGKRWVLVGPAGSRGTVLLLPKASTAAQETRIGNQTGGRVFLFADR